MRDCNTGAGVRTFYILVAVVPSIGTLSALHLASSEQRDSFFFLTLFHLGYAGSSYRAWAPEYGVSSSTWLSCPRACGILVP